MSSDGYGTGERFLGKKENPRYSPLSLFNVILENIEQFKEVIRTVNIRKKFHIETPETKQKKKKNPEKQSKMINLCKKGNAIVVHYWLYSA